MNLIDTPIEYYPELGLHVKREDLSCPGGPNFSKTRGVYAHVLGCTQNLIGVLDTSHSQGGWAVARACQILGKRCMLFYPVRKSERSNALKQQQQEAQKLGAELVPLQAGRSAVLYHMARKALPAGGYMMPNALKLPEMVDETAKEFVRTNLPDVGTILVSASSGTIAAGLFRGIHQIGWQRQLIVHQGYSRSEKAIVSYMMKMAGVPLCSYEIIDEGYAYKDRAREGSRAPFPCNEYYDLKLFRWWSKIGRSRFGNAIMWNIG